MIVAARDVGGESAITETKRREAEAHANTQQVVARWGQKPKSDELLDQLRDDARSHEDFTKLCDAWEYKATEHPYLQELLQGTDLVNADFLVDLAEGGAAVPRWQEVPEQAKIGSTSQWRLGLDKSPVKARLAILVLSYPWKDRHHPDKVGYMLKKILRVLKQLLAEGRGSDLVPIRWQAVGVMWDFMSLPQKPYRNKHERVRFETGLKNINGWYADMWIPVLLVNTPLSAGHIVYTNLRDYTARGWCDFEYITSGLVKHAGLLFHFDAFDGSSMKSMTGGRKPPMSPTAFRRHLKEDVATDKIRFTVGLDLEVVIDQYRKGFEEAFKRAQWIVLQIEHWTDHEAFVCAKAFEYLNAMEGLAHDPPLVFVFDNPGQRQWKVTREGKDALRAAAGRKIKLFTSFFDEETSW